MGKKRTKSKKKRSTEDGVIDSLDIDAELAKQPHTVVFNRSSVGSFVKRLTHDTRKIFEPFTASRLQFRRNNVLKDVVAIAGTFNVTHALYFTHSKPRRLETPDTASVLSVDSETPIGEGQVNLHVCRLPHGPSLCLRVKEYSFIRDIHTLVRRICHGSQYEQPPLLVMQGFSGEGRHLQLMTSVFRNMLPPIVLSKVKVKRIRRVLLLSREADLGTGDDVIHIRHYNVRTENKGVSRAVKRLAVMKKKVPNLSKYANVTDFITKSGMLSDSGLSDNEGDNPANEVDILKNDRIAELAPGKASVRLTEIGPRLTLELIKIEEGINTGSVLYHRWQHKTPEELAALESHRRIRKLQKDSRKRQQDAHTEKKKARQTEHRERCLAGMKPEDAARYKAKGTQVGEEGDSEGSYRGDSEDANDSDDGKTKSLKRAKAAEAGLGRAKRARLAADKQDKAMEGENKKNKKLTLAEMLKKQQANKKKKLKQKAKKRNSSKGGKPKSKGKRR